jgi:hypothetical protein
VCLLVCGWFTAQLALIVGGALAIALCRPLWRSVASDSPWTPRGVLALVLVLVLAFLARWPPASHIQGGQDPGVYMSMAAHFVESRQLDIVDELRSQLTTKEAVARYDANNLRGIYEPGIYLDPLRPGHYFPRFYHLQSLWLAIFGSLVGMSHAALSQTFFGLVSLLFGALLAARMSRDLRMGVAYAALLAILPLHVFFSKFPISEMPALAFLLMGLYAVVRYHEGSQTDPQPRWLVLAALSFLALFLTRISGFLLLPFLISGALLSHSVTSDARVRRHWSLFWVGSLCGYALSVVYGLIWSAPYSREIYATGLGQRLFDLARYWLPCVVLLTLLGFRLTASGRAREHLRAAALKIGCVLQAVAPAILLFLVVVGLIKTSLLAFTDHYKGHPWYDILWHTSHSGWLAFARSTLVVAAEHLTPLVAILLPFALWRPNRSPERMLLVVMVLSISAYTVLVQWFTPYQYYYARYLLSEAVPLLLLLMILRCGDWWAMPGRQPWLTLAAAMTIAYCAWFTLPLVAWREDEGAESSLARIANHLDDNDVILLDAKGMPIYQQLSTPLRLWFGKNVYVTQNLGQTAEIAQDLKRAGFGDIYFLGPREGSTWSGFVPVDDVTYRQRSMAFTPYIPRATQTVQLDMTLRRLDGDALAGSALQSASGLPLSLLGARCCTGLHADRMWTNGHATITNLHIPPGNWKSLLLKTHGHRPDYQSANIEVRINGRRLHLASIQEHELHYDLFALEGPTLADIEITSTTFVPQDLGMGSDDRKLGIDLDTLRLQ